MALHVYRNVKSFVKIGNTHFHWFTCIDGLKQGDDLSPILFIININQKNMLEHDNDKDIYLFIYSICIAHYS